MKHTIATAFDRAAELALAATENDILAPVAAAFPAGKRENILERLRTAQKEKVTGDGASFGSVKLSSKTLDRLTPAELASLRAFWRLVECETLLAD